MFNFFSYPWFLLDKLNGFVVGSIVFFSILTLVYSRKFMEGRQHLLQYYTYIILTAICAAGAALANNLILLTIFWGFLGLTLYLLINFGDKDSSMVAKKTMIIVGGSDVLMLLGIGIIYYFVPSLDMDLIKLRLDNWLLVLAYICIAIGCFAKAGAMPFHSWIPDCAKSAPIPVTAYLPASLDKLLGIYFLARLSLDLFEMNKAMNNFLMFIGAFTIIAAVMMALVQHNVKKLLGYHAVSQVGYMVLGIGTGNPIGIAGGVFHMLNHALYKSCLFLTAGNVEYRTKTSEIDALGGLGRLMPFTYISCLIASFSICGIPPFNGFVSKWLVYQGLVLNISDSGSILQGAFSVFCLTAAMFGSGLTLASFMKLLHGVFLGQRLNTRGAREIKEVSRSMWLPCLVLAGTCVLFGVFAFAIPLKQFIFPAVAGYQYIDAAGLPGTWSPTLATGLIILGLFFGFIVFKSSKSKSLIRRDETFVGGELAEQKAENMLTGTEFYNTIRDYGIFKAIYKKAEEGAFDLYEQAKTVVFGIGRFFQYLHNGVLPTYLVWTLLGMIGLFFTLMRK